MSRPQLSATDARRAALRAQRVLGAPDRRAGVLGLLERLSAVQLDTISVLARSLELVPYARLGPVSRDAVEGADWSGADVFGYWTHAACLLPVDQWPPFAFRRRRFRARGRRWHRVPEDVSATVLAQLREQGPLTSTDLGGSKRGGPWWDWSDVKVAVEWLLDIGEVICAKRHGWRRVYDLPERVLPPAVSAAPESDDRTCVTALVGLAGRALGVATLGDLAEFHRLTQAKVASVVPDTDLVPDEPPDAADVRVQAPPRGLRARSQARARLLRDAAADPRSPRRSRRPGTQRPHPRGQTRDPRGAGGRRDGRRFAEAAAWVGCDNVAVLEVEPAEPAGPLRVAVG